MFLENSFLTVLTANSVHTVFNIVMLRNVNYLSHTRLLKLSGLIKYYFLIIYLISDYGKF